ncbi:MAG TPA: Mur ligase family protein, partial [Candidatus Limnocylindria bacterium]|nr:Mur ligase family protein [Candidatus Limnocylindria bacterium]
MRLVEIRTLDGPNVYRLEPAIRIELTVGRRRTWYGQRLPGRHAVVRLGAKVPARDAPRQVAQLAGWVRRLHRSALGRQVPVGIHRTSEPGHWVVSYPWRERGRAESIARAALRLADNGGERTLERAIRLIRSADTDAPEWVTDDRRPIPLISISGTNGKSTTTRMISHILRRAGRRVGTTTTDGVLINERIVEEGDYTGPLGAQAVMSTPGVEVGVLETARGGIILRGLGYQSNDAAVLTNVSSDHLDLHGVHTLPELAEVKSVIARVTRPGGLVVLNADDRLVAGLARSVRAPVCYFSLRRPTARLRRHLARGGRAMLLEDGWIVSLVGGSRRRIVAVADVPSTLGGLARHNVANALAAAAGAHAIGATWAQVADGLRHFGAGTRDLPGRLNLYLRGARLVIVDFAHNEAGLAAVIDTAEAIIGRRGRRRGTLTTIVGTAGDRPEDSLRAIAQVAVQRSDEVTIKETLKYLRGRTRAGVIGELRAGAVAAGLPSSAIPVHDSEVVALQAELT